MQSPVSINGTGIAPALQPPSATFQPPQQYQRLYPLENLSPKLRCKIEHIARLRVNRPDLKDGEISVMVDVLQPRLSVIYSMPEYLETERIERRMLADKLDASQSDNVAIMQEAWKNKIPVAMNAIFEAAAQSKDLRVRMDAAKELLDRDPRRLFAKKSINETQTISMELSGSLLDMVAKEGAEVSAGMGKTINITPPSRKLEDVLVGEV